MDVRFDSSMGFNAAQTSASLQNEQVAATEAEQGDEGSLNPTDDTVTISDEARALNSESPHDSNNGNETRGSGDGVRP